MIFFSKIVRLSRLSTTLNRSAPAFFFKLLKQKIMKRILLVISALLCCALCFDTLAQQTDTGYKPTYSADFKIGKAAYVQQILDLWKDWDDNQFDRHDYFADTLKMFFPDGTVMKGKQANMDAAKKERGKYTKVKSIIHAYIPLTSLDRNQDLVCIWGHEDDTLPDGTVESKDLHEVWWFNKDGKITTLRQWNAKFGPMPQ
jgi:hypothetical protein